MCEEINTEKTKIFITDENEVEDTDREEMGTKRVHVIKRGERWGILKEGASRASRIYKSKREAVVEARKFKKSGYDLVIHNEDGSIQRWEKSKKR